MSNSVLNHQEEPTKPADNIGSAQSAPKAADAKNKKTDAASNSFGLFKVLDTARTATANVSSWFLRLTPIQQIVTCLLLVLFLAMVIVQFVPNFFQRDFVCSLFIPFSEVVAGFSFLISLVWALALYIRLRLLDESERKELNETMRRPLTRMLDSIRSTQEGQAGDTYPLSFHQLAHSHKEWAQLWFTISITIFLGGLIYAAFNVGTHICVEQPEHTNEQWFTILPVIIPNLFVYALFFIAWRWSARHFRAHWHNFIVNAYRHRALWRYEEIERKLIELSAAKGLHQNEDENLLETVRKIREGVAGTILELHRLSGILLLLPGESSYLEAGQDERAVEEIVKIEEIVKSMLTRHPGTGSSP